MGILQVFFLTAISFLGCNPSCGKIFTAQSYHQCPAIYTHKYTRYKLKGVHCLPDFIYLCMWWYVCVLSSRVWYWRNVDSLQSLNTSPIPINSLTFSCSLVSPTKQLLNMTCLQLTYHSESQSHSKNPVSSVFMELKPSCRKHWDLANTKSGQWRLRVEFSIVHYCHLL